MFFSLQKASDNTKPVSEYDEGDGIEELVAPTKSWEPAVSSPSKQLFEETPSPTVLPPEPPTQVQPEAEAEEEDESAWDSDVSLWGSFYVNSIFNHRN